MKTLTIFLTILISYIAVYFFQNTIPTYIGVTVFLSIAIPLCFGEDKPEVDNDLFFDELKRRKENDN